MTDLQLARKIQKKLDCSFVVAAKLAEDLPEPPSVLFEDFEEIRVEEDFDADLEELLQKLTEDAA